VIDLVGADRLVFGSDYPHPDHVWPESVSAIRAAAIPDEARQKILWDNPRALYALR
jgi:predicted TIM-barrel fold metal-dependent hydrolase